MKKQVLGFLLTISFVLAASVAAVSNPSPLKLRTSEYTSMTIVEMVPLTEEEESSIALVDAILAEFGWSELDISFMSKPIKLRWAKDIDRLFSPNSSFSIQYVKNDVNGIPEYISASDACGQAAKLESQRFERIRVYVEQLQSIYAGK